MRRSETTLHSRRVRRRDDGIDRSLIEWMLRLTPRQRLEVLERQRRLVRALRRDPSGR
jgi:hypothetical protein